MLVPMTKVRILGRRDEVERVVEQLHRLGLVELADARSSERRRRAGRPARPVRRAANSSASSPGRWKRCWAIARRTPEPRAPTASRRPTRTRCAPSWIASRRRSRPWTGAWTLLRDEAVLLPGYLEPLRRLLPLVPDSPTSTTRSCACCAWIPPRSSSTRTTERSSRRSATSSRRSWGPASSWSGRASRTGRSDVWSSIRTTTTRRSAGLLGRVQVRHAALPEAFERVSLRAAVEAMEHRLAELPASRRGRRRRARGAVAPASRPPAASAPSDRRTSSSAWTRSSGWERPSARSSPSAGCRATSWRGCGARSRPASAPPSSSRTWPRLPRDPEAPLLMRNSRLARPFEPLARFLELPRPGSVDPTLLLALFFPLMFGAMVGDVGYGVAAARARVPRPPVGRHAHAGARRRDPDPADGRGVGDRLRRPVRRALRRPRQPAVRRRLGAVAIPARRRGARTAAAVRRGDRRGPCRARPRAGRLAEPSASASIES